MILQLLSPDEAKEATDYLRAKELNGTLPRETMHQMGEENHLSYQAYQDPVYCGIALKVQPKIEEAWGVKLYPTYTYSRLYKPGFILRPHRDRPACELSATITIGYGDRPSPWEISIEDDEGAEHEHILEPGMGMIYDGTKYAHWRYRLEQGWQIQLFVHYVILGGKVYGDILREKPNFDFTKPFQDIKWTTRGFVVEDSGFVKR